MLKKLTVFGVGVAALAALVVPSAAGAAELTGKMTERVAVPTGAPIILTQDPALHLVTKSTTLGKIECGSTTMSGAVTENSGGKFAAHITTGSGGPCTVNGKSGAEIVRWSGTIASAVSGQGTSKLEFEIHVPNVGTCTFFMPEGETYTFGFTPGSDKIKLNTSELETSPERCGEANISGGLILHDSLLLQSTESGGTQLTHLAEVMGLVPVGSQVILEQDPSLPIIMHQTTLGKWECTSIVTPGEVLHNSEGTVAIRLNGGSGEPCTINGLSGMKMTSFLGNVVLQGSNNGYASYNFLMSIPNWGICEYYTSPGTEQGVTFTKGTNSIKLQSNTIESSPESCGEMTISGGLVITASDGSPLILQ